MRSSSFRTQLLTDTVELLLSRYTVSKPAITLIRFTNYQKKEEGRRKKEERRGGVLSYHCE
ncbi:MAG: hypothetical protein HC894_28475, partial [Microcoleus sp. SM1_3_4]|nr:hypothetical protein [Microcoleus sp. SM1_3_4]